ncbi:MAG: AGE family epimerase/isomerase [Oscillospiraceae bacterium]|nr:AGE family epimerase/isomerase [Oscillospiraceae bacterium]
MKEQIKSHLLNSIIPFWNALADYDKGGFYGYVSAGGRVDATFPKSAVLHLRILWFYSKAYLVLKDPKCLELATHCCNFVLSRLRDSKNGGYYWLVSAAGTVVDDMKHSYTHAFLIYAMSAYSEASGDSRALEVALQTFELFSKADEAANYAETYDRKWNATTSSKTTGAIMHRIEAYTELYRLSGSQKVLESLAALFELFHTRVYDSESRRLHEVFDNSGENGFTSVGEVYSYGHFVEAAWLINATLDGIEDKLNQDLVLKLREMNAALVATADAVAFAPDGSMYYDEKGGIVNQTRAWWTQGEAVVGFLDAYKRGGNPRYLERAQGLWEFIDSRVIDTNTGEWHNELSAVSCTHDPEMPLAGPWKCPYHNGRMALFVIENM